MGFFLLQSGCKTRWVTLLVQIHPHELLDGQLAGGCLLKLIQSDAEVSEHQHRIKRKNLNSKVHHSDSPL